MRANLNPSRFGPVSTDLPQSHRNLVRAVFLQAVLDAVRPPVVAITKPTATPKIAKQNDTRNNRGRLDQIEARKWLLDTSEDTPWPFTSEIACEILGYNSNHIRTKVREGTIEQWDTLLTKIRAAMC